MFKNKSLIIIMVFILALVLCSCVSENEKLKKYKNEGMKSDDIEVRLKTLDKINKLDTYKKAALLSETVIKDDSENVRMKALELLCALEKKSYINDYIVKALVEAVYDKNAEISKYAYEELKKLAVKYDFLKLIVVESYMNDTVRELVFTANDELKIELIQKSLLFLADSHMLDEFAVDASYDVRLALVNKLSEKNGDAIADTLLIMLNDIDKNIREKALIGLANQRDAWGCNDSLLPEVREMFLDKMIHEEDDEFAMLMENGLLSSKYIIDDHDYLYELLGRELSKTYPEENQRIKSCIMSLVYGGCSFEDQRLIDYTEYRDKGAAVWKQKDQAPSLEECLFKSLMEGYENNDELLINSSAEAIKRIIYPNGYSDIYESFIDILYLEAENKGSELNDLQSVFNSIFGMGYIDRLYNSKKDEILQIENNEYLNENASKIALIEDSFNIYNMNEVPNEYKAYRPEDARFIFIVDSKTSKVGSYTNGASAYRTTHTIMLIDKSKGELLEKEIIRGNAPPSTISSNRTSASGTSNSKKVDEFIQNQINKLITELILNS